MSYRHSWERPVHIAHDAFDRILGDFRSLLPALEARDVELVDGWDEGPPLMNRSGIRFNGRCGDQEFHFARDYPWPTDEQEERGSIHEDCETNRDPYDLAVQLVLLIARHHVGEAITIHSGGTDEHWAEARVICNAMLGYGLETPLCDCPRRKPEIDSDWGWSA